VGQSRRTGDRLQACPARLPDESRWSGTTACGLAWLAAGRARPRGSPRAAGAPVREGRAGLRPLPGLARPSPARALPPSRSGGRAYPLPRGERSGGVPLHRGRRWHCRLRAGCPAVPGRGRPGPVAGGRGPAADPRYDGAGHMAGQPRVSGRLGQRHDQPGRRGAGDLSPGRGRGGSGAINAMAHVRGHRSVYDGWAAGGVPGWGSADLLPYFRRSERTQGRDRRCAEPRARCGSVLEAGRHPVARAFAAAARASATSAAGTPRRYCGLPCPAAPALIRGQRLASGGLVAAQQQRGPARVESEDDPDLGAAP